MPSSQLDGLSERPSGPLSLARFPILHADSQRSIRLGRGMAAVGALRRTTHKEAKTAVYPDRQTDTRRICTRAWMSTYRWALV